MDSSAVQIRTIAARRFAERGFAGTSLQAIADEVGISKPSLLYHYPSKEALRRAVLDDLFDHWRRTLPRVLEHVTSGEARFDALTEELIRFFRSDPNRARLIVREFMDRPEEIRREISGNLHTWIALVAQYIRKGKKSGELHPDVDAESYVLHVVVLVVTTIAALPLLVAALTDGGRAAQEQHMRELVRLARTALFRGPAA